MKKLLFGFIATVFISGMSMGQTLSADAQKRATNAQMVSIVNISKTFYTKGQTYDSFLKAMLIPTATVASQEPFFKKVYGYVSAGTADCDILAGDNSVFTTFVTDLSKSKRNQAASFDKAASPPKAWWQIAINFVVNLAATLITSNNGIPNPPPIDLFPNSGTTTP